MTTGSGPRTHALVIFDCDGVLVDSEMIASRVLAEAVSDLGRAMTAEEARERFTGLSMRSVMVEIERDLNGPLPADFEATVRARDRDAFEMELTAVPGVAMALSRMTLPMCVASSGAPEKIRHSLRLTGLDGFFGPHLFSAHDVVRGKPAPDLFLHAAARMGVTPAQCIVIEDSENGVRAGRAAGMRVLGFTGGAHCGPVHAEDLRRAGAHAVFAHMMDLPGLIVRT